MVPAQSVLPPALPHLHLSFGLRRAHCCFSLQHYSRENRCLFFSFLLLRYVLRTIIRSSVLDHLCGQLAFARGDDAIILISDSSACSCMCGNLQDSLRIQYFVEPFIDGSLNLGSLASLLDTHSVPLKSRAWLLQLRGMKKSEMPKTEFFL